MSLLACGFGTERLRRSTQYKKNTSSNCLQRKTAFHGPYVITVAPLLNQALCRRVTFDDFTIVITSLPLGPIVLAGGLLLHSIFKITSWQFSYNMRINIVMYQIYSLLSLLGINSDYHYSINRCVRSLVWKYSEYTLPKASTCGMFKCKQLNSSDHSHKHSLLYMLILMNLIFSLFMYYSTTLFYRFHQKMNYVTIVLDLVQFVVKYALQQV